jgi:hypothetical protein
MGITNGKLPWKRTTPGGGIESESLILLDSYSFWIKA